MIALRVAWVVKSEMWKSGKDPEAVVKEKGLVQITDPAAIEKIVDEVLAANASQVEDHKSGKKKNLFGFILVKT